VDGWLGSLVWSGSRTGGPVVGVDPNGSTGVVVGIETLSGTTENVPGMVHAPYIEYIISKPAPQKRGFFFSP
jgi:hypothetical protein